MKKPPLFLVAFSMVLFLIIGTLFPSISAPTKAQQPIPSECVDSCRELLYDCIASREKEQRCIAVYRSCIARCKHK
jgi:hypothetical protein